MKITINPSRHLLILLFFAALCLNAYAQKELKIYQNAEQAFYSEDFLDALALYQEVMSTKPGFKDAEYKAEICMLLQKENRERSLQKILSYTETKGKFDKFYNYWLGRIYANQYKFPEAVEAWRQFLAFKAFKSNEIVSETKNFIEETEKLVAYFDNTDNYEVHRMEIPVNSAVAEMTPAYFEETKELIFASAKGNKKGELSIYHSTHEDYSWSAPTTLSSIGKFNKANANIEVVNSDGKMFSYNPKKGSLMFSEPTDNGWSAPKEFDSKISSKNLASHFFINEHEDRIIFSTKNKKNGLDLMETFKDPSSGKWSNPTILPAPINTVDDEDSPYLSPDEHNLYFSSTRPGGVGGLDIYVSRLNTETKTWSEPENLGWPINSPDNEIHFKMNDDQESGYFVSDRIYSYGDHDIFFFWKIEKARIKGRVINALTEEPLTSGEIRLHPSQYLMEYFRSPIDEQGRYDMEIISNELFRVEIISGIDTLGIEQYEIHDAQGEFITHYQDFYAMSKDASDEERAAFEQKTALIKKPIEQPKPVVTPEPSQTTQPVKEKTVVVQKEIPKQPEPVEQVKNLGSKYRVSNKAIIHNLYFVSSSSKITKNSENVLDELLTVLKQNPNMKISIEGHTDNLGNAEMNQKLSLQRAEVVKSTLVKKGINTNRLITKGFGETRPLASNDDEQNGRELNRRIEIVVIE